MRKCTDEPTTIPRVIEDVCASIRAIRRIVAHVSCCGVKGPDAAATLVEVFGFEDFPRNLVKDIGERLKNGLDPNRHQ